MTYPFITGNRVLVELLNGRIYEGDLVDVDKRAYRIVNVIEHTINKKQTWSYDLTLAHSQIATIVALLNEVPQYITKDVVRLPRKKFMELVSITENRLYLPKLNEDYQNAIRDLSSRNTIGVAAIYHYIGSVKYLMALAMSTENRAYVFDIEKYPNKSIPAALKFILQSQTPQKVIHDCISLKKCLKDTEAIHLQNTYDTQFVNFKIMCILHRNSHFTDHRSLAECMKLYLNIPGTFLKKDKITSTFKNKCLNMQQVYCAAQNAAYLIPLKSEQKRFVHMLYSKVINDKDLNGDQLLATLGLP